MGDVATFAVPPVVKTVVVPRLPKVAFMLFTERLAEWWPLGRFHVAPNPRDCGFEPHVGGRIYERGADGSLTLWGRVIAWQPPQRCTFTWLRDLEASQAQVVEVTFASVQHGTLVKLKHTGWEKLGGTAYTRRDLGDSDWNIVFSTCYREYAETYAAADGQATTAADDLGSAT